MNNRQVVLVTGPAGNLGGAVVQQFLSDNPQFFLLDRHPDRLLSLYPDLASSPDHLLIPNLDLLDRREVELAVDQGIKTLGRIDCLVHTAGGFQMGQTVQEIADDSWEFLMDLNVKSTLNITRAVIPHMIEMQSGKIITIGAKPALQGKARMGAYSAAKAAVLRLTETMAAELKGHGINANCVIPGTIDTPQNRLDMPNADISRWVSPESLAGVIRFLCSSAAKDIHGAAIPVYGG
jgi:NAD(P)-dependent dehydrogenase (short-subunit alcohol dehydrogenase family)